MPEPPAPNWLSWAWAFWAQDHESLRDLVITIAALVGIPFVFWREWLHHRQTNAARQQAATAQLRHEEQVKADRERRITDNFTRAVEQLASDKLETRLGAIYALERIARESPVDHWPIMETLTAYVRERAPWQRKWPWDEDTQEQAAEDTGEEPEERLELPTDIQAVLTVIGRRRREHEAKEQYLDLAGVDISHARLAHAHLEGANLREADLGGTHLVGAHLERAHLYQARLEGAVLCEAHMVGAQLVGASLWGAHLERASLVGAHLERAHLNGAHLDGAHLEGADLHGAHLEGAFLGGAHLEGAILRNAHLRHATLRGAHLEGANLRETDLTQKQFDEAITDTNTIVPPSIRRPGKPADEPAEAPHGIGDAQQG